MKRLAIIVLILSCLSGQAFAVSSRVLPASYVENTYCVSGCDYSVLATWEALTAVDLTTDGGYVLTVSAGTYNDSMALTGTTSNFDATHFRVIRGAVVGDAASYVFNYTGTTTIMFSVVLEGGFSFYDLNIKRTVNTAANIRHFYFSDSSSVPCRIVGCIVGPSTNAHVTNHVGVLQTMNNGSLRMRNCIIDLVENGAIVCMDGTDFEGDNITFYGGNLGFWSDGVGGTVKNCITQGVTTDFTGTFAKTTCVENDTVAFVDAAGHDFHLAEADTAAKGQGTDLSATFTDDFAGDTWYATWDIGAYRYPTIAPATGLPAWKKVIVIY